MAKKIGYTLAALFLVVLACAALIRTPMTG
jgi:hypothetical protein